MKHPRPMARDHRGTNSALASGSITTRVVPISSNLVLYVWLAVWRLGGSPSSEALPENLNSIATSEIFPDSNHTANDALEFRSAGAARGGVRERMGSPRWFVTRPSVSGVPDLM